jgi:hypothetical protein
VLHSVSKAMLASAVFAATSVGSSGLAHAGVITVVIDNFNGAALASPGATTVNVLSNPDARAPAITIGPSAGKFAIDLATNVAGEVTLSYGLVPLPTGYTSASVSYLVAFSNIGNDPTTVSGVGGPNTISVSGSGASNYLSLPNAANPNGVIGSSGFAGGSLGLVFKANGTRSWDLSIDNLELRIDCDGAAEVTYGVKGTNAAPVSGLADYLSLGPKSCGKVPVPSSAALFAIGLVGLALRRKV